VRGRLDRVEKLLDFTSDECRRFPFGPRKSLGLNERGCIWGICLHVLSLPLRRASPMKPPTKTIIKSCSPENYIQADEAQGGPEIVAGRAFAGR